MPRVLILSPHTPWAIGGVEKVVKETATRLAKDEDIYVEIWCKGGENRVTEWEGIPVKIFRTLPFGLSPFLIRELKKAQEKFDVIHIHGTSSLYPLEALLVVNNWKKIIVSPHYHPWGSNILFKLTKPLYDILVVSKYLRQASKIICVSRTEKNLVLDKFKLLRDKVRVIYNGVPIDKIRAFKSKRIPNQNKVSILYFGRLEKYKNVHVLIESLKYLPDTFVLYIVGRGPYEKELQKLTRKLGLEKSVKFLGFLPEEELYTLLHSIDVVVNLSDIEAFGIMVIESLAAGKPVIVNNKLGLKELAGYFTGSILSIDEPTPKDVAKVIRILSTQRKVNVKGLKKFRWERIIKVYLMYSRGV
ncbi:MAG: hypothetical protein PWQ95_1320 [Thermococcaceae archaeon]|nr:hypothetical protein [Thermococcaceae archaeon]